MSTPPTLSRRRSQRRLWRTVGLCLAALVLVGVVRVATPVHLLAYLLVLLAALLPALLWLRRGGLGIPVFAVFAAMHVLTFAFPIVSRREDLADYQGTDLLRAAGALALFLGAGCLAAEWIAGRPLRRSPESTSLSARQMRAFLFLGMATGLAYQLAVASGVIWRLGTAVGVARAVSLTAFTVGAYFLGVARAEGHLRGSAWYAALAGLGAVMFLNAGSLYLVGAVSFAGAAFLGFVITCRRVPWATLAVFFLLLSVFQSGKYTMRERYWDRATGSVGIASPVEVPGRIWEWFRTGLRDFESGERGPGVLERSSLLQMLLRAQRFTPGVVPHLRGESYSTIPGMLVPRFLSQQKVSSQAGLDLLNRRYGLVSFEGPAESTITWGLVAEAWANFGYWGELAVGLIVGLFCGALTRRSVGARAVSRTMLYSIAAMVGLINASDAASVVVVLWQGFVAVLVAFWIFRLFASRTGSAGNVRRLAPAGTRQGA